MTAGRIVQVMQRTCSGARREYEYRAKVRSYDIECDKYIRDGLSDSMIACLGGIRQRVFLLMRERVHRLW